MADRKAYAELLKDPRWQRKRLEVLQRDKWTCTWCGQKDITLHVHHQKYQPGPPWETLSLHLTTLCEICHAEVTRLHRQARELLEDVEFKDLARIVGYIQGVQIDSFPMVEVTIESVDQATGIAEALGLDRQALLDKAWVNRRGDQRVVDGYLLLGQPKEESNGEP